MIIPLIHVQKKKQRKHYNIPCKTASPKSYFVNTFIYRIYPTYVLRSWNETKCQDQIELQNFVHTLQVFQDPCSPFLGGWGGQVPTCNLQYLAICDEESAKYKG